jgi:hypothetical protein
MIIVGTFMIHLEQDGSWIDAYNFMLVILKPKIIIIHPFS